MSATTDGFSIVTVTFSESVTTVNGEDTSFIDFTANTDLQWTGGTGPVQTGVMIGASHGDQCAINGPTSNVVPAPGQQFFTMGTT